MPAKMKSKNNVQSNELPPFSPDKIISYQETHLIGFTLPVFNRNIVMIVGKPDIAERMLLEYFDPSRQGTVDIIQTDLSEGYGTSHYFDTNEGFRIFYIFVSTDHPEDNTTRGLLEIGAHECYHLTHGIMRYIGTQFTDSAEESFAYLHEALFKKYLAVAQQTVK